MIAEKPGISQKRKKKSTLSLVVIGLLIGVAVVLIAGFASGTFQRLFSAVEEMK